MGGRRKARSVIVSIRIGTRGSQLAQWQANWVAQQLRELGAEVEIRLLKTEGDVSTQSLGVIGGQGVFTKAIQRALLAGEVDLAVHSLKDLPTEPVEGLRLAASPPRERTGDALVSSRYAAFDELPDGAKVGTGSARRRAQLKHHRPSLEIADIRGNVDTRLAKLDDGQFDAIVLAEAGLHRLGLEGRITEVLSRDWMYPAIGQGALGLETRSDDAATLEVVGKLNDPETMAAVTAERTMLRTLQAGCLAPVGAWCRIEEDRLKLDGVVLDPAGTQRLHVAVDAELQDAETLGASAAEQTVGERRRAPDASRISRVWEQE